MSKMRFAMHLFPGDFRRTEGRRLMVQLGCTDVIGSGPRGMPYGYGAPLGSSITDVWEYADIMHDKMQVERDGLRYEVFEDAPRAEKIFWNLPGKEEQLEKSRY